MHGPSGTWHSPFSNCSLNAEELVRELALNAVSKILMVGLLSHESAEVQMGPGAIAVAEAETLARDAFARQSESTRRIFRLTRAWCVDSWSSNHPRFR